MSDHRSRSPIVLLRLGIAVLFWVVLWKAFGWGWGLSAALVSVTTGITTDRAMVPIPSVLRGLVELSIVIAGLIGSFQLFGGWWGFLVLLVVLFVFGMNSRQLFRVVRQR